MSGSNLSARPSTWTLRLFDAIPLPPIAVGLLIALGVYLVWLGYTLAFGLRLGSMAGLSAENQWGAELIMAVIIGAAPMTTVYTRRGALRDLEALRPALRCSEHEYEELGRKVTDFRSWPLRVVGLLNALGAALVIAADASFWASGEPPSLGDPVRLWLIGRNAVMAWFVGRAVYLEVVLARSFSEVAEHLKPIDLLDQSPLGPFGRRGLRSVLMWMLLAAFYSLLYVGDWAAPYLPLVLALLLAFAFTAFLLPLLGPHYRIRNAKRRELERVRAAIRERRAAVLESGSAPDPQGGRLADLITYEGRVAAVREWPFDASSILRFALYVAIGLGSWTGAAVVERFLGAALE